MPAGRRNIIRLLSGIRRAIDHLPARARDILRVLRGIRRAIDHLPVRARDIIRILRGIRRAIDHWPTVKPLGTRVCRLIKQRLTGCIVRLDRGVYPLRLMRPLKISSMRRKPPPTCCNPPRFARLERGVYRLGLVGPLIIANVRRETSPMPTQLRRVLVESDESAGPKPRLMTAFNLKHSRAEPIWVRRSVCTGVRIVDSITTAPAGISATRSCSGTCSCSGSAA